MLSFPRNAVTQFQDVLNLPHQVSRQGEPWRVSVTLSIIPWPLTLIQSPGCEHQVLRPRPLPKVAHQADGHLGGQGPVLVAVLRPQLVLPGQQQNPELPPLIAPHLPLQSPAQPKI